ncbi:hypothetical protein Nepgr_000563 [Nepenthes gracilis]|uniref:Uncharacterized protein n=1 Tax=Nepenthes gracilis TaxID=150966 RepID=A0AAD3P349_NEPGR|nr:hypothetical protein Nepgr_000563 [Nepenthes gracilis]
MRLLSLSRPPLLSAREKKKPFRSRDLVSSLSFAELTESAITTGLVVLPDWDPTFSAALTTSIPFVFGPVFAVDSTPSPVCFFTKFSSANFAIATRSCAWRRVGK